MYKSILIPIEISHVDDSETVIDIAKTNSAEDCKITLLYVFEEIPTWAKTNLPEDIMKKSLQSAQEQLAALAKSSGSNVDSLVRAGHSYKTILDVAKETSADLIIVDSHKPELQDYFLGSTAAKVVRHAPCSVMVLR